MLMLLLVLYSPLYWSISSVQFIVLNLDVFDLKYCLANLLFFDIPLLYFYTNLSSSIICCLFSGDISFFWYFYFVLIFWEQFFRRLFETLVISSAILYPIKSSVVSAVFWIALFETFWIALFETASVVEFLAVSRSFWLKGSIEYLIL